MNSYVKTTWINGQPPAINAENLNNIEKGIDDVTEEVINACGSYTTLKDRLDHTSAPTDEQVAEAVENYLDENPLTENISNKKTSISGQSQTGDSNTNYPTVGAVRNFVNNKLDDLQEYLEEYIDEIIGGVENGSY